MGKINRLWHEQNRMPKNPTLEQRIAWHRAHAAACACRPLPPRIADALEARSRGSGLPDDSA